MTKDEALKLALEALEEAWYHVGTFQPTEKAIDLYDEARTAIKEALAQPEQETLAWEQFYPDMGNPKLAYLSPTESTENACYIPPQRTWVGLTDKDLEAEFGFIDELLRNCCYRTEAKLKEKNT